MSNRFRVAFREKLCAENPCACKSCLCCWKRWRDCYQAYRTRSPSSQRAPQINIVITPPDAVIQPQLQPSLRERTPSWPILGRYFGISISEEERKSI
ncbi:hypothetical protein CDAR_205281 [Caerostris darwini]|uniref:Uncharacterized protein n=1 Tax=Caerostris darwini TaxID=1538125 RepID=A0AAV4WRW9_9ARAC|nr:hypothetical protein CDAR_205281 [Caerostris darwini]